MPCHSDTDVYSKILSEKNASLRVKGVARVEGETRGSTDPLVVSLSLSH